MGWTGAPAMAVLEQSLAKFARRCWCGRVRSELRTIVHPISSTLRRGRRGLLKFRSGFAQGELEDGSMLAVFCWKNHAAGVKQADGREDVPTRLVAARSHDNCRTFGEYTELDQAGYKCMVPSDMLALPGGRLLLLAEVQLPRPGC
jgi:hypothetical protein